MLQSCKVTKLRFEQDYVNQNQEKTNCYSQPKCILSLPNAIPNNILRRKASTFQHKSLSLQKDT